MDTLAPSSVSKRNSVRGSSATVRRGGCDDSIVEAGVVVGAPRRLGVVIGNVPLAQLLGIVTYISPPLLNQDSPMLASSTSGSQVRAASSSPLKMRPPSALEDDALSAAATTRPGSPVQAESISVLIRVRPLTTAERGQPSVWKHDRQSIWQSVPAGPGRTTVPAQTYSFDRIFGPEETTAQIYDECVHERVVRLLAGYNSTVFAYGQTSSGKTTTIRGDEMREGLIPLCVRQVLDAVAAANRQSPTSHTWSVKMSYMEIYNETIGDLLSGQTNLQLFEKKGGGLHVQDLREEVVTDWKRAEVLLQAGDENKHVGCTLHNDKSSRAHTVFKLQVDVNRPSGEGPSFSSELNIVDLAGSERQNAHVRTPGTSSVRREEGGHINKSLLVLGTVIQKLSDAASKGHAPAHVPYRSSKITRVLQNSLGGNAWSMIICNVTPASLHSEESHNTLRFASRAKCVRTVPVCQEKSDPASLLKKYEAQIRELKSQLALARKVSPQHLPLSFDVSAISASPSPSPSSDSLSQLAQSEFGCRSQCESTQTSPTSMARHVASETAALSAAAQVPQAGQCAAEGGIAQSVDPALRIRQLEMENGRLLMRLSLLLKQTHLDGTHDGRKWRHKYMVELLRRASLERRNEQLARRLQQLEASAGAQERQPLRELPEAWEEPGELVELLPSACSEMWELHRLQHLDLAHMGGH